MKDFRKVNVKDYVAEVLTIAESVRAEKFARIIAKQGTIGKEVISWSVDTEGNPIKEKVAFVEEGDWIVTKSDNKGKAIRDINDHTNQWIITNETFQTKYEIENAEQGIYKPTGGVQVFVPILENITLNQWGNDMNIAEGGWINITNPDDMYGISQRDFEDTYKITK